MCRGLPFSCVPKIAKLAGVVLPQKRTFLPFVTSLKDRQCPFSLSSTNRHDGGREGGETFFLSFSSKNHPFRFPKRSSQTARAKKVLGVLCWLRVWKTQAGSGWNLPKYSHFKVLMHWFLAKERKCIIFFLLGLWNDVRSPLNSAPDAKFAAQLRKQDKGSLSLSIGQQPSYFLYLFQGSLIRKVSVVMYGEEKAVGNKFLCDIAMLPAKRFSVSNPFLPCLGDPSLPLLLLPPLSRCLHWAVGNSNPFSQRKKRDRLRISHVQKYGKTTWVTGQAYSGHEWADETVKNCKRALKQKDLLLLLCCFCIAKTATFTL